MKEIEVRKEKAAGTVCGEENKDRGVEEGEREEECSYTEGV